MNSTPTSRAVNPRPTRKYGVWVTRDEAGKNRSGIKPLPQNRRRQDCLRYWFYGSAAVSTNGLCGRRIISFSEAPAGTIG